jgi:hypothetical protein
VAEKSKSLNCPMPITPGASPNTNRNRGLLKIHALSTAWRFQLPRKYKTYAGSQEVVTIPSDEK